MSDEVKYTGPTTLAKNTALVKAELGKKLDKTGGTLTGDLTISGAWLNVKSTDTGDGNISVDGSLVAGRGVSVLNGGKSVSLVCTGDNAAKIAGSGNNCASLAVGTPTGDNDAATKAYVDGLAAAWYEVITVTSTDVSDLGYDASEGAHKFAVTFDASFDSILANLAANKPMKFNITIPDNTGGFPVSFSTGYVSALGNSLYLFTGTLAGAPIVLSINALGAATIYMYGDYLPAPNPDDSDDGKVLAVNKHKWEMKKPKEDFVVTITPLSPSDVPTSVDGGIAQFTATCDKTFAEIKGAIDAGKNVLGNYGGNIWPLSRATDTMIAIDGTINLGYFGDASNATCSFVIQSNGIATITSAAGELPIPDSDVSQNGCVLVVGNGQWMYSADKFIPATPTSNGLMSAEDKKKLDSIDSVCYDIYAKIGAAYTHDSVYKYGCTVSHTFAEINTAVHAGKTPRVLLVDNIENPSDTRIICPLLEYDTSLSEGGYYFDAPGLVGASGSGRIYIDENGAMYTCSAGELPAVDANQDGKYLMIDGGMWTYRRPDVASTAEPGFMSSKDKSKLDGVEDGANKTVVDAALDSDSTNPVQNKAVKAALDTKAGTAVASQTANGLMYKDDKKKLDGIEDGATRVIVDDAMSDTSTNPVQNKAVKAALDGKLSTLGGEISGHLKVGQTVSAEGSVSVGRTSADTGIHFEKAASDAGRISHGSDPMTGVSPIARLKVAAPTEDDDAATKAYVDGSAVRYDAAQTLEAAQQLQARQNINAAGVVMPQFQGFLTLTPANGTLGAGVGLSPTRDGNNFALDISDVNEGTPTLLTGVKTPTDADTNAAATVEYVKAKISEVSSSGGVDVDNALSATSTNPVQNKVITSALAGKADKTALNSKADKTALDAKADKTALDAKMDKSGGTFTGNVYGKYFCGTWLQSTAASDLGRAPGKIAVLDDSGWVYYRTPAELLADIGAMSGGDYYTKAETDAAIAVRASTSAYGTTKLSNSTTSSSKTLAATPYAVKTALAQAKAYVDSAIAVAINSAY